MRFPTVCDRCGETLRCSSMSRFNTDICCMTCLDKERKHDKYAEAQAAELASVRSGNMNFPGIGKPHDL